MIEAAIFSPAVFRNSATFSWFTGREECHQRLKSNEKSGISPPCWPVIQVVLFFFLNFLQHLANLKQLYMYVNFYVYTSSSTDNSRSSSLSFCTYNTYEREEEVFHNHFEFPFISNFCLIGCLDQFGFLIAMSATVTLSYMYNTYLNCICMYYTVCAQVPPRK